MVEEVDPRRQRQRQTMDREKQSQARADWETALRCSDPEDPLQPDRSVSATERRSNRDPNLKNNRRVMTAVRSVVKTS